MISDPKLPFITDPSGVGPIDAARIDTPKIDTPKIDTPKISSPTDTPKTDSLKINAPTETPRTFAAAPDSVSRQASALRLWLHRIGVLLFVFLCATLGVMLMILPWRPEWSDNPLLLSYPTLRSLVSSGFARGLATGLGVLNVWIGFWEAIQYQEE